MLRLALAHPHERASGGVAHLEARVGEREEEPARRALRRTRGEDRRNAAPHDEVHLHVDHRVDELPRRSRAPSFASATRAARWSRGCASSRMAGPAADARPAIEALERRGDARLVAREQVIVERDQGGRVGERRVRDAAVVRTRRDLLRPTWNQLLAIVLRRREVTEIGRRAGLGATSRALRRAFAEALLERVDVVAMQAADDPEACTSAPTTTMPRMHRLRNLGSGVGAMKVKTIAHREERSDDRARAVEADVDERLRRALVKLRDRRVEELVRGAVERVSVNHLRGAEDRGADQGAWHREPRTHRRARRRRAARRDARRGSPSPSRCDRRRPAEDQRDDADAAGRRARRSASRLGPLPRFATACTPST